MLPYLAQGANSAIEDGAVLGLLLGHIRSKDQLPKALRMYQQLRKTRGDAIVEETFKQVSLARFLLMAGSYYPSATRFICRTARSRRPVTGCSRRTGAESPLSRRFRVGGAARRLSLGCTGTMRSRRLRRPLS
ncbi:hypothetical protein IMZ48_19360 [Candidatus Bathyarchaeota archaeon]|nr:hypothetical protein [Candidatus Bathyarchaeota archaeon]